MTVGNWIHPAAILIYTLIIEDGTFAREIRRFIRMEKDAYQKMNKEINCRKIPLETKEIKPNS